MSDHEKLADEVFVAVSHYIETRLAPVQARIDAAEVEKRAVSDRIAVLERFVVAALEHKLP